MASRKWSQDFTERSNAFDLDQGLFTHDDPKEIALSLKCSAERSGRRKGTPLQSAMGMLTFYINRAGDQLSAKRRMTLEKVRQAFGKKKHA